MNVQFQLSNIYSYYERNELNDNDDQPKSKSIHALKRIPNNVQPEILQNKYKFVTRDTLPHHCSTPALSRPCCGTSSNHKTIPVHDHKSVQSHLVSHQ